MSSPGERIPYLVDVDIEHAPDYQEIHFIVRSPEGKALTAQICLDAIAEALLHETFIGEYKTNPEKWQS